MLRICAWCKVNLDTHVKMEQIAPENHPITHGICPDCSELFMYDTSPMHEFLNKLNRNVLLVNNDGIVKDANETALVFLNKPLNLVKNLPGGNVMECVHSEELDGCGNTIHCSGCTVRNSVMHTLNTGQSIKGKKAFQLLRQNGKVRKVELQISTEKIGNQILLQIEA